MKEILEHIPGSKTGEVESAIILDSHFTAARNTIVSFDNIKNEPFIKSKKNNYPCVAHRYSKDFEYIVATRNTLTSSRLRQGNITDDIFRSRKVCGSCEVCYNLH